MDNHREAALGKRRADLVIRNCRLVNVLSGEIENGVDIAVCGDEIVGVGTGYEGDREIDAAGRYAYPGLVDAHIHLESTKLCVPEAARLMARFGTAAVVTDPHEIGNVAGLDGVAYQMDAARDNGYVEVYFTAPSCVPALGDAAVESAPSTLGPDRLRMLAASDRVVALGEVMNVPGILNGDPGVAAKIGDYRSRGLSIDGHAPMVGGQALNACIYAGIQSDHESTSIDEAREKLRRGMHIMIREGASEHNLDALIGLVNGRNTTRLMFATDDLDPRDLAAYGHINYLIALAVRHGVDPIVAIQMATLSPASYFGLRRHGAIVAGARADIVIAPDLREFVPDIVMHGGRVVYDGALVDLPRARIPGLRPTMHVRLPDADALRVPASPGQKARAIELVHGQILTREVRFTPKIVDGCIACAPEQDIAKVCVFERHCGSGAFGIAFVRGLQIRRGAIGSSVGHDSHNLIVVGTSDDDILRCAAVIRDMGGGQAAVLGKRVESLPLPVAGLFSNAPATDVIAAENIIEAFCAGPLGITMHRPMAALSFIALPVIPEIRITDQGLFTIAPGGYPQKVSIVCND